MMTLAPRRLRADRGLLKAFSCFREIRNPASPSWQRSCRSSSQAQSIVITRPMWLPMNTEIRLQITSCSCARKPRNRVLKVIRGWRLSGIAKPVRRVSPASDGHHRSWCPRSVGQLARCTGALKVAIYCRDGCPARLWLLRGVMQD